MLNFRNQIAGPVRIAKGGPCWINVHLAQSPYFPLSYASLNLQVQRDRVAQTRLSSSPNTPSVKSI